MKTLSDNLLTRLMEADICCHDCGLRYGKYSVGCSSTWQAECPICGKTAGCTEVRDFGYLAKGIADEKEKLRQQSAEVANYIASQEEDEPASYEEGDIVCKFTEEEVCALRDMLMYVKEDEAYELDEPCISSINKLCELYNDYCVRYELSPALIAYNKKYGTWGTGEDEARWEGFRDAFMMLEGGND